MVNQIKISNSEDVTDSIDNPQNANQSTSIQNSDCYHSNQEHPKVKDFVEHKILGSNDFKRLKLLKELAKYQANIQIGIILRT